MSRSLFPLVALLAACNRDAAEIEIHRFSSGAEGFDTHSYWIDTGAEVVVFDAQFTPALAEQLLAEIEASTDSPVRYVVVTHPNPDKFNGAAVFQDVGAELVASEATAAAIPAVHAYKKSYFVGAGLFTEQSYPAEARVDRTFNAELSLDLEGEGSVDLVVLDHGGVTHTQTVAIVGGQDLIVGDLGFFGAHAWLEGAILDGVATPDLESWSLALGELPLLADGRVYPGRGEVSPVADAVEADSAYLVEMQGIVSGYVDGLEDPYADLTGAEAGTHYAGITAEAEAAFPERTLSYLVTYGVYGLALQEAGE